MSLPEATFRMLKRPLQHVGGLPVSHRGILTVFTDNVHDRVRPELLKHWGDGQNNGMWVYRLLPNWVARQMSYIHHMKNSRFCMCPPWGTR
jgi:hypothetical protein